MRGWLTETEASKVATGMMWRWSQSACLQSSWCPAMEMNAEIEYVQTLLLVDCICLLQYCL
jgi:hypothetical protein